MGAPLSCLLLTRQWRDTAQGLEISYWLATERGPLKVVVHDERAVCFIESDTALAPSISCERRGLEMYTLAGSKVDGLYFREQRALQDARAAMSELGARLRPGTRILDAADQLFATMACHSARRAGEVLDPLEQSALLDALDAIPWAPTCPHGRPVALPVSLGEIERRFGRA